MHTSFLDPMTMRQARIGHSLRQVYDNVTDSPLPNQLDMLLNQLDAIEIPPKAR